MISLVALRNRALCCLAVADARWALVTCVGAGMEACGVPHGLRPHPATLPRRGRARHLHVLLRRLRWYGHMATPALVDPPPSSRTWMTGPLTCLLIARFPMSQARTAATSTPSTSPRPHGPPWRARAGCHGPGTAPRCVCARTCFSSLADTTAPSTSTTSTSSTSTSDSGPHSPRYGPFPTGTPLDTQLGDAPLMTSARMTAAKWAKDEAYFIC